MFFMIYFYSNKLTDMSSRSKMNGKKNFKNLLITEEFNRSLIMASIATTKKVSFTIFILLEFMILACF